MAEMASEDLRVWFTREVLPLEAMLMRYIKRNWRDQSEAADIRQEVYERALSGARHCLPDKTEAYIFTIARNLLISRSKRARIVRFELAADVGESLLKDGAFDFDRHLTARDELRRALEGLENLPPRCREVVRLRKVEGLSTREVAERMGTGPHTVEKQLTLGLRALTDFMLGGSGRLHQARPGCRTRKERAR